MIWDSIDKTGEKLNCVRGLLLEEAVKEKYWWVKFHNRISLWVTKHICSPRHRLEIVEMVLTVAVLREGHIEKDRYISKLHKELNNPPPSWFPPAIGMRANNDNAKYRKEA
jgi:hypothetical protein